MVYYQVAISYIEENSNFQKPDFNSQFSKKTVSNSQLENVIMLEGGRIKNQKINNSIIGLNEIILSE